MRPLKYTVFACDRAGTPWDVATMSEPSLALATVRLCREKKWPNERVFGVFETDDPEKGDVELELEEGEGLCAWCGRTAAEGCDMEAHNADP